MEITSWIPNFEGVYEISTSGKIYSWKTGKPKEIRPSINGRSFTKQVNLTKEEEGELYAEKHYIHRLVWSTFKRESLKSYEWIQHIDDDLLNNNLSNLRKIETKGRILGVPDTFTSGKEPLSPKFIVIEEDGTEHKMRSEEEIIWRYGVSKRKITKAIKTGKPVDVIIKKNL